MHQRGRGQSLKKPTLRTEIGIRKHGLRPVEIDVRLDALLGFLVRIGVITLAFDIPLLNLLINRAGLLIYLLRFLHHHLCQLMAQSILTTYYKFVR